MDLARLDFKVDMVIGDEGSESLRDPGKLKLHLGLCLSVFSTGVIAGEDR